MCIKFTKHKKKIAKQKVKNIELVMNTLVKYHQLKFFLGFLLCAHLRILIEIVWE